MSVSIYGLPRRGKIKDATAIPSNVLKNKIFYNNDGRQIGTLKEKTYSDFVHGATATPSDVASGKIFYNNDGIQIGSNDNENIYSYSFNIDGGSTGSKGQQTTSNYVCADTVLSLNDSLMMTPLKSINISGLKHIIGFKSSYDNDTIYHYITRYGTSVGFRSSKSSTENLSIVSRFGVSAVSYYSYIAVIQSSTTIYFGFTYRDYYNNFYTATYPSMQATVYYVK